MNVLSSGLSIGFVSLLALAATVLAFIFIIPEKRLPKLNGFLKFLHDLFNFKFLIIEKILQFCYVLATASVISYGLITLFQFRERYSYYGSSYEWTGYYGLIYLILGPIAVRLAYEVLMLAIIAIKNIIKINNKLKNQNEDDDNSSPFITETFASNYIKSQSTEPEQPMYEQPLYSVPNTPPTPPSANYFCANCGSRLDANGVCPNCNNDNM